MCRWLAYSGGSIPIETLLFKPEHSLVDQSLSARLAAEPTNADGFGVGWYGRELKPGVYRSVQPAWNDANLRDLAFEIESPLFLAHVRRSTGTPVQASNCHPFRFENWLFVHNGELVGFQRYRHEMIVAVDPELLPVMNGSTDSELMFLLALTFGLREEPLIALEKLVAFIEKTAAGHGVQNAVQMTLGIADGRRLYAVRYSSAGESRTLFHSEDIAAIEALYPGDRDLPAFPRDARAVASEPLGNFAGAWRAIDESSAIVVEAGEISYRPFNPRKR